MRECVRVWLWVGGWVERILGVGGYVGGGGGAYNASVTARSCTRAKRYALFSSLRHGREADAIAGFLSDDAALVERIVRNGG